MNAEIHAAECRAHLWTIFGVHLLESITLLASTCHLLSCVFNTSA